MADGRWHIKFVLKRKWQAKGTPSGSQHALPNSDAPVCLHTRRFCRGAHWITQGTGVQAAWLEWPNNCSHLLNTDYKWCKWKALFFLSFPLLYFFFKYWHRQHWYVTVFLRGTCDAPSAILTYAFTGADLLSQRRLWFPTSGSSHESDSTHGCVNEDSQWNWSLWEGC